MRLSWRRKRQERERELAEELESHLRFAARDLRDRGQGEEQARWSARRDLGNRAQVEEAVRRSWGGALWLERLWQDVRYAARTLCKQPGFTLVAVLTIALGIGASAAVFSLIDAALFAPEPYPQARQLMVVKQIVLGDRLNTSPAEYLDYQRGNRVFASLAGYESDDYDLTGTGQPERLTGVRATSGLFRTLQVTPLAGRGFTTPQDLAGGPREVLLSYGFWQSHFGGSVAAALGKNLRLDERSYTVVGVMPPGFEFPASRHTLDPAPALWMPMAFTREEIADRGASYDTSVIARLKPGLSEADAQRDMSRIAQQFEREHPDVYSGNVQTQARVEQLGAEVKAQRKPALALLGVGVALLLGIACVNLANLLLARAGARRQEIAARIAFGAGARALLQQLLTESILLTGGGGLLGFGLAWFATRALGWLLPHNTVPADVHPDAAVAAFCAVLCLATGILCGLAPAGQWLRANASDALQSASRGHSAGPSALRLRRLLVAAEAALSLILLIAAALLIRSFAAVLATPPGFDPAGVTVVRTSLNRARYPKPEQRHAAERLMLERLQALPGLESVALTSHLPLADTRTIGFTVEGRDPNTFYWADNALVDARYFAAMRIPLLAGRTFTDRDTPQAPAAAVINETMARQYWPRASAVGQRVRWGGRLLTVVGVVGDIHLEALDARPKAMIYNGIFQLESGASTSAVFVLRARRELAADLAAEARRAIWSVDKGLPVFETASLESIVARSVAVRRGTMALLAIFAALALALSAIGLYGVLSYTFTQRRRELGIRMALGAAPAGLLRLAAGEGLRLTLIGLLAGSLGGIVLAFGMTHLLFGVRPLDPMSFAGAGVVLLAAALLASLIPAVRAARIDPVQALRCE